MVQPRPDAPLLGHLADLWGDEAVLGYQSLPYLLMPGSDFLAHLLERQTHLQEMVPTLSFMPWPDCVFDVGPMLSSMAQLSRLADATLDLAKVWIRVVQGEVFKERLPKLSPYVPKVPSDCIQPPRRGWPSAEETIVLEMWTRTAKGTMFKRPTTVLVPRDEPWITTRYGYWHPAPVRRLSPDASYGVGILTLFGLLSLAYLCQSPEYYVEVRPILTDRERKLEEKANHKRPELKRDLSYFILLDPLRADEYGCPLPGKRQPKTGAPAAAALADRQVRPHMRRGHWRVLRAARYGEHRGMVIPVRPAWIGPGSWTAKGLRYRVTEPLEVGRMSHLGPVRRLPGTKPPTLDPPSTQTPLFAKLERSAP